MKRIAIIFVITILCTGIVWGDDAKIKEIAELADAGNYFVKFPVIGKDGKPKKDDDDNDTTFNYFDVGKVYFIDGFDFDKYDYEKDPSLEDINKAQIEFIKKRNPKRYSLVGYSQGGLTALGYLSALKAEFPSREKYNEEYPGEVYPLDKIDAVITISGAISGAPILDGYLNIKLQHKVGILSRGLGAIVGIFDTGFLGQYGFLINMGISSFIGAFAIDILMTVTPDPLKPYFKEVWSNPSLDNAQQLKDMKPGSDYIKKYVAQTKTDKYTVKTGKKVLSSEWRQKTVLGKKVKYLWMGMVDEKVLKNETEVKPQFDTEVPVGFIVGTQNKALRMGTDNPKKNSDQNNPYYVIANLLGAGFTATGIVHIVNSFDIVNLLSGSPVYAANATRAAVLCFNIDDELADITGSKKGDGFLPVDNQHIPSKFNSLKTKEHTIHLYNVLNEQKGKDYQGVSETHYSINEEKKDKKVNEKTYKHVAQMVYAGYEKRQEDKEGVINEK